MSQGLFWAVEYQSAVMLNRAYLNIPELFFDGVVINPARAFLFFFDFIILYLGEL